jgi:hypothetical protein
MVRTLLLAAVVKQTLFGFAFVAVGALALGMPRMSPDTDSFKEPTSQEVKARTDALARALVMDHDRFDPGAIDFAKDPNDGVIDPELVTCRFLPTAPTGTTTKFDCELPNGEKVKVKYGWTKEIQAEIAATRLLDALGFGADRMSMVKTVRCFGCVVAPFHVRVAMHKLRLLDAFDNHLEYDHSIDFPNAAIERKLDGETVEAGDLKGWSFDELARIDAARGGSTRAEIDALRLMAMFLNHWDNKTQNQRLICVGSESADCAHPLAMIQDAGSTFGPHKLDLEAWSRSPLWSDAKTCTISMKHLPYNGATFVDVRISEEGRRLLGERLKPLSATQIERLFTAAGFEDVPQWVAAFQARARQVWDRDACAGES